MFENKIPLTPTEVHDLQDVHLNQIFETAQKLNEVILSERTLGPDGLSSYKWGLIGTLIDNMKESYNSADWKLKTGRLKETVITGRAYTMASPQEYTDKETK